MAHQEDAEDGPRREEGGGATLSRKKGKWQRDRNNNTRIDIQIDRYTHTCKRTYTRTIGEKRNVERAKGME